MKQLGIVVVFTLIFSGFFAPRCRAAIYNSNGTAESVQFFHDNQAQNGDTITLPPGIFVWTTGVAISKTITLQGAGVGSTIIKDAVQSGQLLKVTLAAGHLTRITGIEFQNGGRIQPAAAPGGVLRVIGSNTNGSSFRWDHCKWNGPNGFPVMDTVIGVIDHNIFGPSAPPNSGFIMTYVYGSYWNNQGQNGDGSWAAPTGFGSSQWLFFEDNTWQNNDRTFTKGAIDSENGGRWVLRHNTLNACIPSNHGTESGGRGRGARAMEVYNNTFTSSINGTVGGSRGGSVVIHDNAVNGYFGQKNWDIGNWRNTFPFSPWGGSDGTNPWDVNDPSAFFTGTATSNSSGVTVAVSGANWTPNQWKGFTLRRITNGSTVNFGWIVGNTANSITWYGQTYGPNMAFAAGDSLEIRKVIHAIDQPGRGRGSLVTGNPPVRPAGWNDQVTEPCYQWNNQGLHFTPGPGIRPGDYFDNTPMPGYTPYVYPHPLVTGQAPPPPTPPPSAMCSQLQQRLSQLQRRRQALQRRHRQNQRLNQKIRRLRQQIQAQHCV
jgi:hypothetical protein